MVRNAKYDLKQVREIDCLGTFDEFATEALPYWIERAEKLEKALERAGQYLKETRDCPPTSKCCAECWKKYFLEVDSDA